MLYQNNSYICKTQINYIMTISDYLCNPQQQNALSFNEIKDMLQEELDSLIYICFHEGKLRTYEQGISNIKYNKKNNWFEISWEDDEGDNEVNVYSLDEKIHVNSDEWSYGIYKPHRS